MKCRSCENPLKHKFVDLGFQPLSNSLIKLINIHKYEKFFPLVVYFCEKCFLVQTIDTANREDFFNNEYPYFSSTSKSWLNHSKLYANKVIDRFDLNGSDFVCEIACNDGYLLKYFKKRDIKTLGIEPSANTARKAEDLGIKVIKKFFGYGLSNEIIKKYEKPNLIICNNVLAHVPDINDFIRGLKNLLNKKGIITIEFPHLLSLIKDLQFDTIYHEHYSYLSLHAVNIIFNRFKLKIFDVDTIKTHGGSLRIYISHRESKNVINDNVYKLLKKEKKFGLLKISTYKSFQNKINEIKNNFLKYLIKQNSLSKKIVCFGAAAKGNTFLNFAGIKNDLIQCVYDSAKSKQGKFMPGSHLPIYSPSRLKKNIPDIIIILPWNIADEIVSNYKELKKKNVVFKIFIPKNITI